MTTQNVLPNPNNQISYSGQTTGTGLAQGPGYATVSVDSKFKTTMNETNSGVLVSRSKAFHSFEVNIGYNPLTEEEFNVIYGFILEKQGMLKSFLVPLPQYDNPQDSTFASGGFVFETESTVTYSAGVTQMQIDSFNTSPNYNSATDGQLRPGDMFTISDPNNSNHLKAYKITRVETSQDFQGTTPASNDLKISFIPPLAKEVSPNSVINYINPKIKVISSNDSVQYSLGNDNLYSFSLKLKEVQ